MDNTFYKKYYKYKSKYVILKNMLDINASKIKGGTFPGLVTHHEDDIVFLHDNLFVSVNKVENDDIFETNQQNTEFEKDLLISVNKVENDEIFDTYQLNTEFEKQLFEKKLTYCDDIMIILEVFEKIINCKDVAQLILIDATFIAFLLGFALYNNSLKEKYVEYIDSFMNVLMGINSEKTIIFLFDNSEMGKSEMKQKKLRKSKVMYKDREFNSIMEYNILEIEYIRCTILVELKKQIREKYVNSYEYCKGEADGECFEYGIKQNKEFSIITVDGDLLMNALIRKHFDKLENFKNLIIVRPTINQMNTHYIVNLNEVKGESKKNMCDLIIKMLLYTSTDAGYGKKCDYKTINSMNQINEITNIDGVYKKFVATLTVLMYGWGIKGKSLISLFETIGCNSKNIEMIVNHINNSDTSNQLLCSPFHFTAGDIIQLMKNINDEKFPTDCISNYNELVEYEETITKIYLECDKKNIKYPSLLLHIDTIVPYDFTITITNTIYKNTEEMKKIISKIKKKTKECLEDYTKIKHYYTNTESNNPRCLTIIFNHEIKVNYVSLKYMKVVLDILNTTPMEAELQQNINMQNLEFIGLKDYSLHKGKLCKYKKCSNIDKPEHTLQYKHISGIHFEEEIPEQYQHYGKYNPFSFPESKLIKNSSSYVPSSKKKLLNPSSNTYVPSSTKKLLNPSSGTYVPSFFKKDNK